MTPTPHIPGAEIADALKQLIHDYVALLESGRDRIASLGGTCDPVDVMEAADPALRAAKAALAASPTANVPPQVNEAVTVKPLEWKGSNYADTPFGEYTIDRDEDDDVAATPYCCWSPAEDGTNLGHFATDKDAKDAAQADYEQRIMSVLASPSPGTATAGASDGPGTLVYAAANAVVAIDAFVSDPVGKRSSLTEAADQLMVAMQASPSDQSRVERLETALKIAKERFDIIDCAGFTQNQQSTVEVLEYVKGLASDTSRRIDQALRGDRS